MPICNIYITLESVMKITIAMSDTAVIKELYERLEAHRKAKGLSQEKLVENLGISRPTYARLRKGACSLNIFISVLRELNLLEGLDFLVPAPTIRPSEIVKPLTLKTHNNLLQHRSNTQSKTPFTSSKSQKSVKEMLANRKKLKV